MKKKLILVTETFPYGKGEKSFILPELEDLVDIYDIIIVAHAKKEMLEDETYITRLDPRIKVVNLDISISMPQRIMYGIRYLFDIDGWKEIIHILRGGEQIVSRLYQSVGFYALALENYRYLKKSNLINRNDETIYYTFWFFYYAYSMTKYRKKYKNINVITRVHGFDLYNERYAGGRQPFKDIMIKNIDRIFFISEAGKKYFKTTYGVDWEEKYVVNRLGVEENSRVKVPKSKKNYFCLVSCASVIPLKRVDLIVNALAELKNECVKWIHFGDGEEYSRIQKLAAEKLDNKINIKYQFMGFSANNKVIEYYKENQIDCFITTSSTEGLPVSIMEAMAAGIPVIGTNVGGIPEMIDGNGVLLSANPSSEEVAKAILRIYYMSEKEKENASTRSYELWEERFCGEKNRREFIKFLSRI